MAVDLFRITINLILLFWSLAYGLITLYRYKKKKEKAVLYLTGLFLMTSLAIFIWMFYASITLLEGGSSPTSIFFRDLSQMIGTNSGFFAFLFGIEFGSKIKKISPKIKKITFIFFIIIEILFILYLLGVSGLRQIVNLAGIFLQIICFGTPIWYLLSLRKTSLARKTEMNLIILGFIIRISDLFIFFVANMGNIPFMIIVGTITSIVWISLFYLSMYYPITDRIDAQIRLNKSESRYREAYSRAEIYKDIFAHDISNILQTILLDIDLSLFYQSKAKSEEERIKILNDMKNQVLNGTLLVSNVRKLSQIEEIILDFKIMNINALLDESINFVKYNYPNKNINMAIEHKNENFQVLANKFLLDVFNNILINSVKHNNNDVIDINIKMAEVQKDEGKFMRFEFIDNGVGVEDLRKKEIFQRVSKGKDFSGIGLGLLLAKKIIDSYHGKIWVENKIKNDYSKGSKFILLIPTSLKTT